MYTEREIFQRTERLVGKDLMDCFASKKVIIFGVGGVGSWCAESLVRTGFCHLTIVDSDRVNVSNINRQIHATTQTVGMVKTDILKERLLQINPHANIVAIQEIYNQSTRDSFNLKSFDYIIDAIDSISCKIDLIRTATRTSATLFSSMGASLKIDPSRISVAEFWNVKGCPLGSRLRKMIKKGDLPAKKFLCVYSEELLKNEGTLLEEEDNDVASSEENAPGNQELADHEWSNTKAVINGTMPHITAIFGFTLAGLVVQDIYKTSTRVQQAVD